MTSLLGDEAGSFFASYDRPARSGLRVNTSKISAEAFRARSPWPLEPIPWCPDGFYLPADAPAGKHPWHAAGVYYLQEPSAMAPVEAMALRPELRVADVCAAPGGKSTQILNHLQRRGVLLANDVVGSRIKPLGENLERWGAELAVIANQDMSRLAAKVGDQFDRVLVDAPCSGEGLFRRTPEARTEWSLAHVEGSARRQRGVLDAAAQLVASGGELVYSTCTFAPEENEHVISAFLDAHPDWHVEPIPGFAPGRSDWSDTDHDLSGLARLWPHQLEGDGHTIARLRRDGEPDRAPGPKATGAPDVPGDFEAFRQRAIPGFSMETAPVRQGDSLVLPPAGMDALGDLPLVRKGLWLGAIAPGRFVPSHALALALDPAQTALVEPLDFEQAAPLSLGRNPHQTRRTRLAARDLRRVPPRLGQTLRRHRSKTTIPRGCAAPSRRG